MIRTHPFCDTVAVVYQLILGDPGAVSRVDGIFVDGRAPGLLLLPNQFQKHLNSEKFSGQSKAGNSNASGTGSVRVIAQGLSCSYHKLSPTKICSTRLTAPGSPRMLPTELSSQLEAGHFGNLWTADCRSNRNEEMSVLMEGGNMEIEEVPHTVL